MKTFPTSAVWCFGILFISASLITTGSSEVQVVGPADRVDALAGDDIILPCSLKPNISAKDMLVQWTGLYLKTRNVHLYRQGRDSNEDQFPSYRGRTSMFHEELKNGNVSLKLTRVTLSDAGSYRCFLPTLTSQVKETTVQLFCCPCLYPVLSMSLPRLLCGLLVGSPYLLVTIILLVKGCRSRTQGETRVPRKTHQDQLVEVESRMD
uniref:Ig-like domain-containing protein n=1 Tax=Oncorhynchus kisutch TaxID=8019 RepID=A0A8C7FGI5_ONCKI